MDKVCSKCHTNPQSSGTSSWCKPCKAKYEDERRRLKGLPVQRKRNPEHLKQGLKECFKCDGVLPLDDFGLCKRGYAGHMAWCKSCCNEHAATDARISMTDYTKKYRVGNTRYQLQHRNHQQKRRAMKQAGADGTVTTQFMLDLYAVEYCHYCKKYTPLAKRTADHKQPLVHGGLHSTCNLVMCCSRCNSSKGDKTEQEFEQCLKLRLSKIQSVRGTD